MQPGDAAMGLKEGSTAGGGAVVIGGYRFDDGQSALGFEDRLIRAGSDAEELSLSAPRHLRDRFPAGSGAFWIVDHDAPPTSVAAIPARRLESSGRLDKGRRPCPWQSPSACRRRRSS